MRVKSDCVHLSDKVRVGDLSFFSGAPDENLAGFFSRLFPLL